MFYINYMNYKIKKTKTKNLDVYPGFTMKKSI